MSYTRRSCFGAAVLRIARQQGLHADLLDRTPRSHRIFGKGQAQLYTGIPEIVAGRQKPLWGRDDRERRINSMPRSCLSTDQSCFFRTSFREKRQRVAQGALDDGDVLSRQICADRRF